MSYTQGDEERYILEAVGPEPARFLDIGAYHPTTLSNTRALYERGWSGVMIEPSPYAMADLVEAYGGDQRIELIQAAFAPMHARGILQLFHLNRGGCGLTTAEASKLARFHDQPFSGPIWIPTISWNLVHDDYKFISIDTEGSSTTLFADMLAYGLKPHCCCVEHDDSVELTKLAAVAGYRELYRDDNNVVLAL